MEEEVTRDEGVWGIKGGAGKVKKVRAEMKS